MENSAEERDRKEWTQLEKDLELCSLRTMDMDTQTLTQDTTAYSSVMHKQVSRSKVTADGVSVGLQEYRYLGCTTIPEFCRMLLFGETREDVKGIIIISYDWMHIYNNLNFLKSRYVSNYSISLACHFYQL